MRAPVQSSFSLDPVTETPAAAAPTPVKESQISSSQPNSSIEPTPEEILDNPIPLSNAPVSESYWALLNLILTILTIIESILLIIFYFIRHKKEEDQKEYKYHPIRRLIQVIVAIVTILVFIHTEDITLPMQFVDKYTIIMIILAIISTVLTILSRHNKKEDTEGK